MREIPRIYLAGAIRDNKPQDIEWREYVIRRLGLIAHLINPLGGKEFKDGKWYVSGVPSTARFIVKHDFYAIDNVDMVIFNFDALQDKYPNIGTLVEFGRATGTGALIYTIVGSDFTGHENGTMYGLHPFLAENSAEVFETVEACTDFLARHIRVLSGELPSYAGWK